MEQKFKEFLQKYNGQFVERVDASNLNQCFDLAIAWCEWLGLPTSIFSGLLYAYQIWTNPTSLVAESFDRILNTPDAVPQAGDMVIWNKGYAGGVAGHVGIATGLFSDTNHFQCFEQNDPVGSNSHLKDYNYDYVLGWLRFKGNILSNDSIDPLSACLKAHKEAVDSADEKQKTIDSLNQTLQNLNSTINAKNNLISGLQSDNKALAEKESNCQSRLTSCLEQAKKLAVCEDVRQEQEKRIEGLNSDIQGLKLQVAGYKSRWSMLKWSLKKIILEKLFPQLG